MAVISRVVFSWAVNHPDERGDTSKQEHSCRAFAPNIKKLRMSTRQQYRVSNFLLSWKLLTVHIAKGAVIKCIRSAAFEVQQKGHAAGSVSERRQPDLEAHYLDKQAVLSKLLQLVKLKPPIAETVTTNALRPI